VICPKIELHYIRYFPDSSPLMTALSLLLTIQRRPFVDIILLEAQSTTATACPYIVCSTITFVLNPSPNYQVEQLNFTCSQSFSNMSIIQIVQRTLNETYAQQYQTFWNYSTNMTYSQTPTQLIYYWYSIPGMIIVKESFPNFINAQVYYTPGSVRNTSNDTWDIWLQSTCGQELYLHGTY